MSRYECCYLGITWQIKTKTKKQKNSASFQPRLFVHRQHLVLDRSFLGLSSLGSCAAPCGAVRARLALNVQCLSVHIFAALALRPLRSCLRIAHQHFLAGRPCT